MLLGAVVALAVVVGMVLSLVAGPVLLVVFVLVGLGAAAAAYFRSDGVALAKSGATPAAATDYPRLHNVVEGLCVAAGLSKPALYVVHDAAPNAFAVGRDPHHAAVVVTTGLLEKLNRIELEGVLAHELSHIRSYDTLVSTVAVTLVPLSGGLLRFAVRAERESVADVTGVQLTRYPPGLVAALEKLRADPAVVQAASKATAHLWIDSPVPGASPGPALDARIAALRQL